jgi:hypothetical protein
MVTSVGQISKERVRNRVEDWIRRLGLLFKEVESWIPSSSSLEVSKTEIPQISEEMMREVGVHPKNVPVLTIFSGKHRIAFVPSARWVVGAYGRVNISTNKKQYILVDVRAEENGKSDWQIVTDDIRKATVPFTREVFLKILRENA